MSLLSTDAALLDNIMWHALAGKQAGLAAGTGGARRFAPGFSPIVGFERPHDPDFGSLRPFCAAGEQFYCDIWSGPPPHDWRIIKEARMYKMVWQGNAPLHEAAAEATRLSPAHATAAVELATLTNPGPFGPRTIDMGDYFGIFDGTHLMAMAGERLAAGRLREISGVCTHPDYRGRGLARQLTLRLIHRQLQRGEIPFLHVMSANEAAVGLYEPMGFRKYRETVVRVISRI